MSKKVLYYISLLLTIVLTFYKNYVAYDFYFITVNEEKILTKIFSFEIYGMIISIITLIILMILFILKLKKYTFNNIKISFLYAYILFVLVMIPIMFMYNKYVLIDYIHFNYYTNIILVLFNMLNIYYILSAKKGK